MPSEWDIQLESVDRRSSNLPLILRFFCHLPTNCRNQIEYIVIYFKLYTVLMPVLIEHLREEKYAFLILPSFCLERWSRRISHKWHFWILLKAKIFVGTLFSLRNWISDQYFNEARPTYISQFFHYQKNLQTIGRYSPFHQDWYPCTRGVLLTLCDTTAIVRRKVTTTV